MGSRRLIPILIFLILTQCSAPMTESTLPPPRTDPPDTSAGCTAACTQARTLGCDLGNPTAEGASCEQVCENAQAGGFILPTSCVAVATSCSMVDACQ